PYSRSSSSYSCLTVCRTSESTVPAPSSTVLNTSDQNYQAMLTTEPLDTANIVDVPADLSTPFDYLTNSDTDADNADLCNARRWTWYCKDPAPQVLERLVLQVQLLAASIRDGCATRRCMDTHRWDVVS